MKGKGARRNKTENQMAAVDGQDLKAHLDVMYKLFRSADFVLFQSCEENDII